MEEMVSNREYARKISIYLFLALLAPLFLINIIPPRQWTGGVLPADSRLNLWALTWQWRTLPQNPMEIWNGNAFYPARSSITGSDHLFTQMLTGLPVYKMTGNPFLTYHFVMFAGYAIGAWGMYLLGLILFRQISPALVGAVFFTIALPRSIHATGHIQIAYLAWLPWSIFFLNRIYHRSSFISLSGYIITTTLHLLSGWYVAVFHGITLAILIPALGLRHRQKSAFFQAIAATIVVVLLVMPFVLPYLGRPAEEVTALHPYSARATDFITPASYTLLKDRSGPHQLWSETTMWMGFTAPGLALLALLIRGKRDRMGRRPSVVPYVLLLLTGISLALGSRFPGLPSHLSPWVLLSRLPGVGGIRVPARAVIIVIFAVSILFGRSVWIINKRIRKKWLANTLTMLIVVAAMAENFSTIHLEPSVVKVPEVYAWLESLPREVAVAEAPCFYGTDLWAFSADYMMFAAIHGHPVANGYSRYVPKGFAEISSAINRLPSPDAIRFLKSVGINMVIVHPQMCFETEMNELFSRLISSEDPAEVFNRIIRFSNSNYDGLISPQGLALELACLQSPFMNLIDRFGRDLVFYLNDLQMVGSPELPETTGFSESTVPLSNQGSQPKVAESIFPRSASNS